MRGSAPTRVANEAPDAMVMSPTQSSAFGLDGAKISAVKLQMNRAGKT